MLFGLRLVVVEAFLILRVCLWVFKELGCCVFEVFVCVCLSRSSIEGGGV